MVGYVLLKSSLSLEEVGQVLSDRIFGGLEFGGKELSIHEEIPAIFIQSSILGLEIVLDGYSGYEDACGYSLSIEPYADALNGNYKDIRIDSYLFHHLKHKLADIRGIKVYENIFDR
jgi:hypothetical protein